MYPLCKLQTCFHQCVHTQNKHILFSFNRPHSIQHNDFPYRHFKFVKLTLLFHLSSINKQHVCCKKKNVQVLAEVDIFSSVETEITKSIPQNDAYPPLVKFQQAACWLYPIILPVCEPIISISWPIPTNQRQVLNLDWIVIDSIDLLMANSLASSLTNTHPLANR